MHELIKAAVYAATHLPDANVAVMAQVAGLSARHFIRQFKTVMGVTPSSFLTTARMEKAQLLLSKSAMPLAEIAIETGFSSQSSFTTAFRLATGMTPRAYRMIHRVPNEAFDPCEKCPFRGMYECRLIRRPS